jgi:2-polyprenyl-3-methyl-5-hydroxy-6-metoxy-1,4-benzoquinol methylase
VDIQPKMIERLKRRAAKAGLVERIDAPIARSDSDATQWAWEQRHFVLAFAMVHEMPDAASFFREAAETMKPGARMLLAEPSGHVSEEEFEAGLEMARRAGLQVAARPAIRRSRTVILRKAQLSSTKVGQS